MLFDCSHSTAGDLKHRRTAALLNPGHAAHVTPPTPPTPTAICGSERPSRAPPDAHDVATSRLIPFPSLSLNVSRRVYNTGGVGGGAIRRTSVSAASSQSTNVPHGRSGTKLQQTSEDLQVNPSSDPVSENNVVLDFDLP